MTKARSRSVAGCSARTLSISYTGESGHRAAATIRNELMANGVGELPPLRGVDVKPDQRGAGEVVVSIITAPGTRPPIRTTLDSLEKALREAVYARGEIGIHLEIEREGSGERRRIPVVSDGAIDEGIARAVGTLRALADQMP